MRCKKWIKVKERMMGRGGGESGGDKVVWVGVPGDNCKGKGSNQ